MKIYKNISELVGRTPLMEVSNFIKEEGLDAKVLVKIESFNPAGSAKDRVAKYIIEEALASGKLTKDSVIIEPTSGNTGIGLCAIAASLGIKCIIVMPETMSIERRNMMKVYGAELVLTEGAKGMSGAIAKAEELAAQTPNSFIAGQFVNPANPKAHRETTGPEIWEDTDGTIDIFVAGVGTGGTLTGTGEYLKSRNANVQIVAVEPASSAVLSGKEAGPHKLQGIGAGFIPKVLDTSIIDKIIKISDSAAKETALNFVKSEGVLVGISSGAALSAALTLAKQPQNKNKNIVVLLPDTGERYLSTF